MKRWVVKRNDLAFLLGNHIVLQAIKETHSWELPCCLLSRAHFSPQRNNVSNAQYAAWAKRSFCRDVRILVRQRENFWLEVEAWEWDDDNVLHRVPHHSI